MCSRTKYFIKLASCGTAATVMARHDDQLARPDAKLAAALANCSSRPSVQFHQRPAPAAVLPMTSTFIGDNRFT